VALLLAAGGCAAPLTDADGATFRDDFDGRAYAGPGVSASWSGPGREEGVQGFATIGFSGRFLRNDESGEFPTPRTLTLTGLPPHDAVSIGFLLALVDSWDGTCGEIRIAAGGAVDSTHCPDVFMVIVDGDTVFHETFFFEDSLAQTYDENRGTLLSRGRNLGVERTWQTAGTGMHDLAYDMSRDPAFQRIPHTASSITIAFGAGGAGWQGGDDESWAIDNVAVTLHPPPAAR
jgi:hypothetical protein